MNPCVISPFKTLLLAIVSLTSYQLCAQDTLSCFKDAMTTYTAGNYSDAYKSFSACLKNTPGKQSEEYNTCILYMGICALENAEYKNASSLLHASEQSFTPSSDKYFICQQHLAALAKRLGNYDEAENILLHILDIQQKPTYTDCALKAITLNDLGVIYKRLGQYERSIHYLSESLHLKQMCLSPEDPSTTISLNNLAGVYMKQKDYSKADSLYTTAIKIKTKQCGPNHPSTLIARNNLAELYRQQGNYTASLTILQDVRIRKASTIGTRTLSYATTLHTIANVYYASGAYQSSLKYCRASLSIKERLIGKTASSSIHGYVLLAKIQHDLHKDNEAQSIYDFILKTKHQEINTHFKYLGEEEKIQYVKANTTYWKEFTEFVLDINADISVHSTTKDFLFNQWIENRWFLSELILEETQRQHRLWESISDSTQRKLAEELKGVKDALAKIYLLKSKEDNESGTELNALTDRAAQIEKTLTSAFSIDERKQHSIHDIIQALDVSECIVEIIKPLQVSGKYLALVYLKGCETPYKIWLQEARILDGKGYSYYKNTIQFKLEDKNSLQLYWQPILDFLSKHPNIHTTYLVRDGIYECINIHTFLPETNSKHTIIYLNKTENIISYKQHPIRIPMHNTLFIYHPLYSITGENCSYTDLPGTKNEVDSIEIIFRKNSIPTTRYGEQKATESTIKNDTAAYSIMHIATHGYLDQSTDGDYIESMIRSGLLLSGVCDIPDVNAESIDDGILTAYEIAQLNLSETELVVLSACQSGLGVMDNQEGMLGLQRGLLVAGAKKVLVSLWKIDDAITAQWMYHFYSNLVETRSCQDAYIFAQQKIKSSYPAPYYWGAFVLLEQ